MKLPKSNKNFFSFLKENFKIIVPIKSYEYPKFLSITGLMFCILFIQNLVRATKDSYVITQIGMEAVPFLKSWGVFPSAVLFAAIYVKLINRLKPEAVFYIIISSFIFLFSIFGFIIFPYSDFFHMDPEKTRMMVLEYPNLKWIILIFSKWSFSLFYILAELWPNAAFSLLFWQFVNGITNVDESKRFYTLFAFLGQSGLIISGIILSNQKSIGAYIYSLNLTSDLSYSPKIFIFSLIVLLGISSLLLFKFININILKKSSGHIVEFKSKASKISIFESFKMAAKSRYIRLIAIMLFCYGLAINIYEGPWKDKASLIYTTEDEFNQFIGNYLKYTGIFTLIFVVLGSGVVRILGWYYAAIITPIMLIVTGSAFFYSATFGESTSLIISGFFMIDPIMLSIILGAIVNILTKSTKYTVFDSTKEMTYVPLDDELKTRGKAAADIIGIKLGKSFGGILISTSFMIFKDLTYHKITPYLAVLFIFTCIIWLWAVKELAIEYNEKIRKQKC